MGDMGVTELVLFLASVVGLGAVGWLIKQQMILNQVLDEMKAERANNRELQAALQEIAASGREMVSALTELSKDSHAEHMRMIHAIEKSDERHNAKHDTMNEKLTGVLAKT